jgi:hypothetical protein
MRLLVHVEGQTEETFVNEILRDHLVAKGYHSVSARLVGNARLRRRRGGIRPWPSAKKDILTHLKQDPGCVATTMVDFYGLPKEGEGAWPGRLKASALRFESRASCVENAMEDGLKADLGDTRRFVPFVVMHEFEGLLFSDCSAFSRAIGRPELEPSLSAIREQFGTPEEINDSQETAPSKQIEKLIVGYEKPFLGTLAARAIGLSRMRQECPHFREWLERLESVAG